MEVVRTCVAHIQHYGNVLSARSYLIPVKTHGHPTGLRLSALITVP